MPVCVVAVLVAGHALMGCYHRNGLSNLPDDIGIVGDPSPDRREGVRMARIIIEQGALALGIPRFDVDERGHAVFWDRWHGPGAQPKHGAGAAEWNGVYKSAFILTPGELAALHALVADIGFINLKDEYHPFSPIYDGDVCTFTVVADGQSKKVFCNNKFTRGLWRLREMAFTALPAAHAREIVDSGQPMDFQSLRATWLP